VRLGGGDLGVGHGLDLPLAGAPPGVGGRGLPGGAAGDAVQPAAHRLALHDRPRPAGEDEEGGLEGVLGVLLVAEQAPADTQGHGPVTAYQGRERRLVPRGDEVGQQVPVRLADRGGERPVKLFEHLPQAGRRHAAPSCHTL
jgi:hypothetical protein